MNTLPSKVFINSATLLSSTVLGRNEHAQSELSNVSGVATKKRDASVPGIAVTNKNSFTEFARKIVFNDPAISFDRGFHSANIGLELDTGNFKNPRHGIVQALIGSAVETKNHIPVRGFHRE